MIPLFQLLKQMFKASSPRTGHSIAKVNIALSALVALNPVPLYINIPLVAVRF